MRKISTLIIAICFAIPIHTQESKISIYPRETDVNSLTHSNLKMHKTNEILYKDLDKDGDPDIIELWWKGKRVRWFDENDNATFNDKWGDMTCDALQVDMDDDGFYDGPGDYNVKWADKIKMAFRISKYLVAILKLIIIGFLAKVVRFIL